MLKLFLLLLSCSVLLAQESMPSPLMMLRRDRFVKTTTPGYANLTLSCYVKWYAPFIFDSVQLSKDGQSFVTATNLDKCTNHTTFKGAKTITTVCSHLGDKNYAHYGRISVNITTNDSQTNGVYDCRYTFVKRGPSGDIQFMDFTDQVKHYLDLGGAKDS